MTENAGKLDALFVNLILIFKNAAIQQMGKIINPLTGKIEKSLEQARFSIDMIDMLKEKTKGNLSPDIEKLLESTLLELRLNYVEEVNAEKEAGQEAGATEEEPADSSEEGSAETEDAAKQEAPEGGPEEPNRESAESGKPTGGKGRRKAKSGKAESRSKAGGRKRARKA